MATTGQLIRIARLKAHMSQNELGRKLGVTGFLVSHWEANRKPVTDMDALAGALGVSVEELAGFNAPPSGETSRRPARKDVPLLPPKAEGSVVLPYMTMAGLLRWIRNTYGMKVYYGQVYDWIATKKFPCYENRLKRNPQGEITYLFVANEVAKWFAQMLPPVNQDVPA
ncbi:helix-turn-helix domain-containing protein [Geothrix sp. 21YS21S-2]|uniref:helix-turn-helix domain-containing protein n=1 Tax=Geothrix sp. 21YS21S-2 TaxID=3068893 RepID=UPI0027B8894D|nr:helix-turn-helix transcriptional regulator [Geothrix sp. 21YS21S-2]